MSVEFKIRYTVQFETTIKLEDNQRLQDAMCDVDIPETKDVSYVVDTCEIDSIEDSNGKDVDAFDWDKENGREFTDEKGNAYEGNDDDCEQ